MECWEVFKEYDDFIAVIKNNGFNFFELDSIDYENYDSLIWNQGLFQAFFKGRIMNTINYLSDDVKQKEISKRVTYNDKLLVNINEFLPRDLHFQNENNNSIGQMTAIYQYILSPHILNSFLNDANEYFISILDNIQDTGSSERIQWNLSVEEIARLFKSLYRVGRIKNSNGRWVKQPNNKVIIENLTKSEITKVISRNFSSTEVTEKDLSINVLNDAFGDDKPENQEHIRAILTRALSLLPKN